MKKQLILLSAMVLAVAFTLVSVDGQQLDKEAVCFVMGDNVALATNTDSGSCTRRVTRLCWTRTKNYYHKEWTEDASTPDDDPTPGPTPGGGN